MVILSRDARALCRWLFPTSVSGGCQFVICAEVPTTAFTQRNLDMTATTYRSPRRFFRFSLRTILIITLLIGLALGSTLERARRQRDVVTWIQEMRGSAYYDYEIGDSGMNEINAEPPAPTWLVELLGIDLFDEIVTVRLVFPDQLSDVTPMAELTNLEFLTLIGTQVKDVRPLARLQNLKRLNLHETPVCEIEALAELTSLETLSLAQTRVNDVSPLANLKGLRFLDLRHTSVSEEEIDSLKRELPHCRVFH